MTAGQAFAEAGEIGRSGQKFFQTSLRFLKIKNARKGHISFHSLFFQQIARI